MHSDANSMISSLLSGNFDPYGGNVKSLGLSKLFKKSYNKASWGFFYTVIWFLKPGPSFLGSSYNLSIDICLTNIEKSSAGASPYPV
jgi:hypothetical protein